MKYISINKMNDLIKKNIYKIPNDVDLIVSNPRSGILPAIIISLAKNLPICDIDSFIQNKIYSHGITKNTKFISNIDEARKVLIVEDSSYSGNSINEIKNKLPKELIEKCILLVVYVNEATKNMCDIYFESIDGSRIFEWNLFHHRYLNYCGVDFDVIYSENTFNVIPSQKIEAIIIDENLNKMDVENKLIENKIRFNRVIYMKEIDEKINFIISNDAKKFSDYDIDVVDYMNDAYHSKRNKLK